MVWAEDQNEYQRIDNRGNYAVLWTGVSEGSGIGPSCITGRWRSSQAGNNHDHQAVPDRLRIGLARQWSPRLRKGYSASRGLGQPMADIAQASLLQAIERIETALKLIDDAAYPASAFLVEQALDQMRADAWPAVIDDVPVSH